MPQHHARQKNCVEVADDAQDTNKRAENVPVDACIGFIVIEVVRLPISTQRLANEAICEQHGDEVGEKTEQGGPNCIEPFPTVGVLNRSPVEQ